MRARKKWLGGYVHTMKNGQPLFILERRLGKRRIHISTRCHSKEAALAHLRRFEADPLEYLEQMRTMREPETGGLVLNRELILAYREHLLTRDHPATRPYANNTAHRLHELAEELDGRDLRKLDLPTLKAAISARPKCRKDRIVAIKGLCTWLRQEGRLERRDDVTIDLPVPQFRPEKHRRRKVASREQVRAALRHLAPAHRDCLLLLSRTGWHITELIRFARETESRIAPGRGEVLGVLQVKQKSGETTRTPIIDKAALEAAERIKARGRLPKKLRNAVYRACDAAGVPRFPIGSMRHTVATWAVEEGSSPEQVAQFLGHKSKSTTERFYIDVAVPTNTVRLPKLT